MEYTTNYQLPNWVKEDRIQMEDFNDMTGKIEAALSEQGGILAEHASAIAGFGNCQLYYTTYSGKWAGGQTPEYNRLTFSFPSQPFLVVVCCTSANTGCLVMAQGVSYTSGVTVSWPNNGVSWIANGDSTQMNEVNKSYILCAFLEK